MKTEIEWIDINDRLPIMGDPDFDGEDVDGTAVLLSEDGLGQFGGVKYWAKMPELPKETS